MNMSRKQPNRKSKEIAKEKINIICNFLDDDIYKVWRQEYIKEKAKRRKPTLEIPCPNCNTFDKYPHCENGYYTCKNIWTLCPNCKNMVPGEETHCRDGSLGSYWMCQWQKMF